MDSDSGACETASETSKDSLKEPIQKPNECETMEATKVDFAEGMTQSEYKKYVLENVPSAVLKKNDGGVYAVVDSDGKCLGHCPVEWVAWYEADLYIKNPNHRPKEYIFKEASKKPENEAISDDKKYVLEYEPTAVLKTSYDRFYIVDSDGCGIGEGKDEASAWEHASKHLDEYLKTDSNEYGGGITAMPNTHGIQFATECNKKIINGVYIDFVLTKFPDARASCMKATEDMPEVWHIIDCAAPLILGFGECEHSAWVNTSKNIRTMAAESKPAFEKIDDLSFSGLMKNIQGYISLAADVLENLAHENEFLNAEIERISKVLGGVKCRQQAILSAKDNILSIIKKTAPLTVQRQGYTIEVCETGLYINKNVI